MEEVLTTLYTVINSLRHSRPRGQAPPKAQKIIMRAHQMINGKYWIILSLWASNNPLIETM